MVCSTNQYRGSTTGALFLVGPADPIADAHRNKRDIRPIGSCARCIRSYPPTGEY